MLGQPGAQDSTGLAGEWRDPLLSSFAVAAQMGAGVEVDVGADESGELAYAKAGLDGHHEQRMVAAANPGVLVRCCEQRLGFVFGEE